MNSKFTKTFVTASLVMTWFVANAQLVNGSFETGDLKAWSVFNDINGTNGGFAVVLFDMAGNGTPSFAARCEAGSTIVVSGVGLGYGGGIRQDVSLGAGFLTISLNVAAFNPVNNNNADAGSFVLSLDGKAVATNSLGSIYGLQTKRSWLSYSRTITAGIHEIAIDVRRGWFLTPSQTPYQYLDNVTLSGTPVPGPIPLEIQYAGSTAILTWTNAAYVLQAAASPADNFTNIPEAVSPYTNVISGSARFFRLKLE